jgi:hypothetical protein
VAGKHEHKDQLQIVYSVQDCPGNVSKVAGFLVMNDENQNCFVWKSAVTLVREMAGFLVLYDENNKYLEQ